MKTPQITVQREHIDTALAASPWDLGNEVLYHLCATHPGHKKDDEIIAKMWLIGRAYAAAIERRKTKQASSDDFYENTVASGIRESDMDAILDGLPPQPADPLACVSAAVRAHRRVMGIFQGLAGLDKRSLASKYLHFHRPDVFFIYDSRAQAGISLLTPDARHVPCVPVPARERDDLYYRFCMRACWLWRTIKQRGHALSPRQIDKMLLGLVRKAMDGER